MGASSITVRNIGLGDPGRLLPAPSEAPVFRPLMPFIEHPPPAGFG